MIKPTAEQFEEWRSHPVTEWLLDAFVPAEMLRTREAFQDQAWEGQAGEVIHATHRERYDTLEWLRALDMGTIDQLLESQDG